MRTAIAALLILAGIHAARAGTVHSLDQEQSQIKTPEGRAFEAEQMQGKPAPDGLGVHLPPGLSAEALTRLLRPAGDNAAARLVGAKPWPGQPDRYVAILCTGGAERLAPDEPRCARADDGSTQPPLHVYLGVVEAKDGAPPRLVAGSLAIDGAMRWDRSGLPRQPVAADDAGDDAISPDAFDRFDLAPYRLAAGQPAFGLRGSWAEGYSGGGASFTGLYLFAIDGDRLTQVLAVPMSAYSDIAGDWHKDGTRDHDITDAANLLVVTPHLTDGHFDLLVKARGGHHSRLFRWSKAKGAYLPAKG